MHAITLNKLVENLRHRALWLSDRAPYSSPSDAAAQKAASLVLENFALALATTVKQLG